MNANFEFITDEESAAFFELIAGAMVEAFNVNYQEAVGRMNRQWGGLEFVGSDRLIYHEDEDFWANTVFYGAESEWWLEPPGLKPLPYP
jgi:hypothetical protein